MFEFALSEWGLSPRRVLEEFSDEAFFELVHAASRRRNPDGRKEDLKNKTGLFPALLGEGPADEHQFVRDALARGAKMVGPEGLTGAVL